MNQNLIFGKFEKIISPEMRHFFFFIGLLLAFSVHAQREIGATDTTKGKTGVRVKVLGPGGKSSYEYKNRPLNADSVLQAVKVNPLLVLRGEIPVYYEKRLTRRLSAEGAFGITFYDFLYESLNNGTPFRASNINYRSGITTKAQLRFYPSRYDIAIAGLYFAPEISYRVHRWEYLFNSGFVDDVYPNYRKMTEVKFGFGYQNAEAYEPVFFDWYLSGGIRFLNEKRSVNDVGSQVTTNFTNLAMPVLSAGVKLCFGM